MTFIANCSWTPCCTLHACYRTRSLTKKISLP